MLHRKELKLLKSLAYKKYRDKNNLFLIEGEKIVLDFCNSNYEVVKIYFVDKNKFQFILDKIVKSNNILFEQITYVEMNKISLLSSNNNIIATVRLRDNYFFKKSKKEKVNFIYNDLGKENILILDNIQDPRNLGALIRASHWYGVNKIFCSLKTVDAYNPKVVQSSMGSLSAVSLFYLDILSFLKKIKFNDSFDIYLSIIKAPSVYDVNLKNNFALVLGNESKGISSEILDLEFNKISIPKINKTGPNSLNVVSAYSVIVSHFTRL